VSDTLSKFQSDTEFCRILETWGVKLECIQPGKLQQNAYVERFNRTVRYEWLSQYHWDDLNPVQCVAT
jgi:putative transposase